MLYISYIRYILYLTVLTFLPVPLTFQTPTAGTCRWQIFCQKSTRRAQYPKGSASSRWSANWWSISYQTYLGGGFKYVFFCSLLFGEDEYCDYQVVYTLPETNSEFTPENGWLEDYTFLLGRPIFRCYVHFGEGNPWLEQNPEWYLHRSLQVTFLCFNFTCWRDLYFPDLNLELCTWKRW